MTPAGSQENWLACTPRTAGGGNPEIAVLADLVVFLGSTLTEARDRKSRLDEMLGQPYRSDAAVYVGPAHGAGRSHGGLAAGRAGRLRLRPAGIPYDLRLICDEVVPELQRRLPFRSTYDVPTLRGQLRFGPTGQPLYRRELTLMTQKKQMHLAAHFPGVNNTTVWSDPRSGARSSSAPSPTWPVRRSGPASTSSSWPKGCVCESRAGRSTTWTWSAARTPLPSWPRWLP